MPSWSLRFAINVKLVIGAWMMAEFSLERKLTLA
jgi:hypothetical protein